ncbi:hypothetical protein [Methanobacterium ferruginis]|uniref:hypothetical protein n=1 Tax=Methanobacterium ferruginis TaxID=710191 RepID=UPI002572382A|nr:hypothetical protein [Methanobacterium ferruginis]BDZ69413.1 hypothetical protein GCM10025860_28610 [Methanobacterium ferruginis]
MVINNNLNNNEYKNVNPEKLSIIDITFQKNPSARSFADLGGVWGVDGGYTFYTLNKYPIKSAFLIDTNFNDAVTIKSQKHKNLTLIDSNFGEKSILKQLGKVNVIFLFDVLLHQVKPSWDEILKMYSSICNCFVIYNQQFIGSENTVRLLDLGFEEYFENIPHKKEDPTYKALFENMYEIHPQHQRIWRDIHNVWQWGITDSDLKSKMEDLGFDLQYYKNFGQFPNTETFENHAFIYKRD